MLKSVEIKNKIVNIKNDMKALQEQGKSTKHTQKSNF